MAVTIWVLDVFAFRPSFFHHRIKTTLFLHLACHETFAEYFWKIFSSHWNWTKKIFTPVGSCPKKISADLRSNHVFTIWKSTYLVLTCLQTKNLKGSVNCNQNTFMRWVKITFMCNQRRDVAWQLSRIEMRYSCLEEVLLNILEESAKYKLSFFTLWLRFYPSFMLESYNFLDVLSFCVIN